MGELGYSDVATRGVRTTRRLCVKEVAGEVLDPGMGDLRSPKR